MFEHMYDNRSAMCGSFLNGGAAMLFDQIVRRKLIDKGWSDDRKYCSETAEGNRYLLRISPANRKEAVSQCYSRMKEAEKLGISMCSALEWGICDEGVYFIQSWVDGCDAEEQIPTLDAFSQYSHGLAAGRDLRKLHGISAPEDVLSWDLRFGSKIDRKLKMYADSELKYDEDASMISYIMENRHLISGRPQCYQHGDHHIGNMMISDGHIVLIDFEKQDYGDPWEEFNRIVWSAQASPYFASGIVDGYFSCEVPMQFWRLLALYICINSLGSLPWAVSYGEGEIMVMRKQQRQILAWYNHMNRIVPSWYVGPVMLRHVISSDRQMYLSLLQNEVVGKTYMVPDAIDEHMAGRLFAEFLELSGAHDRYVRTISVGDTPIGVIHDVGIKYSSVELGWAILPQYHNIGYCTQALKTAMEELKQFGFTEVTAGAFEHNTSSLRVMEKNGMKRTDVCESITYRGEEHSCIYYKKQL